MPFEVGTVLKGRYEILREIGKGAIATVYLALDRDTQDTVALKVIENVADKGERFERRFRREADILNELRDPHIVKIYDFGAEEDSIFIAMEYISGKTVAGLIQQKGPMEVEEALDIARQVAEGLQSTSRREIVHRDIKPQNLKVTPQGVVKIMDFGIASSTGDLKLTETGFLGTPYYISPEQAESREIDVRSDTYSLGVVLFEMLTGRVLFDGNSPLEIAMKHVRAPVPPLHLYREDVPVQVEDLVNKCLAKSPEDRFQTPIELARALDAISRGVEEEVRPRYKAALVTKDGRVFPIAKSMVRVGRRDPTKDIFPEVDLSSEKYGRTVSRRHAIISLKEGQWYIAEELGAKLGTYLNRRRLSPGMEVPIKAGDEIRLGRVKLTFRVKEAGRR